MVYTFPLWIPGVAFGLTACLIVGAVVAQRKVHFLPLTLLLLGMASCTGGVMGPTLALDHVVLDDAKLEQTTGLWFAPTVKGFRTDSVARIVVTTGVNPKNLRAMMWVVEHKDGRTEAIDPGDVWEMHTDALVARLRERGIEVVVE